MRLPSSFRSFRLALALLALAGCAHRFTGPFSRLARADEAVQGGASKARELALAGFHAYLAEGAPAKAQELFHKARAADDREPWALFGEMELARRAALPRERALLAAELARKNPRHPLAAVAARVIANSLGQSPDLDQKLEADALTILGEGSDAETARLLRVAVAAIRRARGDEEGARAMSAEAGQITEVALAGPFAPHHLLEFDKAFAPEKGEALSGLPAGAAGPVYPRALSFPSGQLSLQGEPLVGDIYYFSGDVTLERGGHYVLHAVSHTPTKVMVDGAVVLERRSFERMEPRDVAASVNLSRGKHRLLVKLAREMGRGEAALFLSPLDGSPAHIKVEPGIGQAPSASGPSSRPLPSLRLRAQELKEALEPEAGEALASFVAARDALHRDREGAKKLGFALAAAAEKAPELVLRAELVSTDPTLPSHIAKGRAAKDYAAATEKDPGEASAWLKRGVYARAARRLDEAAQMDAQARSASPSFRADLAQAKMAARQGLDGLALKAAEAVDRKEKGQCEALGLRYDLARRGEAVALADALAEQGKGCPAGLRRLEEHLRARGKLGEAVELLARITVANPAEPGSLARIAELALARGDAAEAARAYERAIALWPRNAGFHKRRADALHLAGDKAGARAEREAALAIDGSDLQLRRALALEDGHDLLDDAARDGLKAIHDYEASRPNENSAGVYVLDAAAVQIYPDGSQVERIHTITKVLDQRGITPLAEVEIPPNAVVLRLRNIKKGGRVLEAESVGEKESVSLPGVEVGDYIETEFLAAAGPRGPAMPGFSTSPFYFRVGDMPLFESTYEVRAPKGSGLAADAHNLEGVKVEVGEQMERLSYTARRVSPHISEPSSPANVEFIPFVVAGSGAGQKELLSMYADGAADHAVPTFEIEQFARAAAGEKVGVEAVKAVYEAAMASIKGQDVGLRDRASQVLARGQGDRMLLVKAALASLGIPSQVVFIRPMQADPASYRFPAANLFTDAALKVKPAQGPELWLYPAVRWAPFGKLPPHLAGGREAYVAPGVGGEPIAVKTPPAEQPEEKVVQLELGLDSNGDVHGEGVEHYRGYEAAYLRSALEQIDDAQRRQAVESALSRSFPNAFLETVDVSAEGPSGSELLLKYRFAAHGFARVEEAGKTMAVANPIFPALLGRRFIQLAERKTPLLIGNPEATRLELTLKLPAGYALSGAARELKTESRFGRYERKEQLAPGVLRVQERLRIDAGRVMPADYGDFAAFAGAVDQGQARELVLAQTSAPGDGTTAAAAPAAN